MATIFFVFHVRESNRSNLGWRTKVPTYGQRHLVFGQMRWVATRREPSAKSKYTMGCRVADGGIDLVNIISQVSLLYCTNIRSLKS